MRVKTIIFFLCLAFLLRGGCSEEKETLPLVQNAKVRKPIIMPQPEKVKISSLPQSEESELQVKQTDQKPAKFEKKKSGQEKAEPEKKKDKDKDNDKDKEVRFVAVGEKVTGRDETDSKSRETRPASVKIFKELKDIRFAATPEGEEKVLIWLNGNFSPKIFALEGDRPRIVCDFIGARLGGPIGRSIKTSGRIIKKIRIGSYTGSNPKVRVVLDIVDRETGDYEVQPIFYEDENIFAVVVK